MVLNHHKSAEEVVKSFGDLGIFADEKLRPGISGAVLAYEEASTKKFDEKYHFIK